MKYLTLIFFVLALQLHAQHMQTISSPDKHISLTLAVKDHQLKYAIAFNGHPVIDESSLGLTVDNTGTGDVYDIKLLSQKTINKTFAWRGVHSFAKNYCIDAVVDVAAGRPLKLEVRVFNNGVAFRYLVATRDGHAIEADDTQFTIAAGNTVWSQDDVSAYEGKYKQQLIEDVPAGQLAGPPVTIKLAGDAGYAAITEGGLQNFAGMSLKAIGNRVFKAVLAGETNTNGSIETPWRIVEIGSSLNTLVNCDIVADVSPAADKTLFPKGFDTGWLKPGECAWSWKAGNGPVSFDNMKRYSKWAGELGIPYNLVDEGWWRWQDGGKDKWELVRDLVKYSAEQHVKIWLWKAYPTRKVEPGLEDPNVRREFFRQCRDAGVVGIKIDFFNSEAQHILAFYQDALRDAAKLHLMLDFHGADKPAGQSRTWPNEMSREGVRGLENSSDWPSHNTTLPFTRYLAGHGDYTPFSFRQDLIKGTTLTHQVAEVVTFTSPFLCLGVDPEKLLTSLVKDVITHMPTTWDETMVLPQSEIGKLSVYARRKGSKWYLAVMNGDEPQSAEISLSFLSKGKYHASIIRDDSNSPEKCELADASYRSSDKVSFNLSAGGGYVMVLENSSK
jgi:alpha-glucosidase